ncbi:MAG: vWA domain-containing protein [Kofleriaceae bacterium]
MDNGSIDSWSLAFGTPNLTVAAVDAPVFIPDAPESAGDAGVATISIAPPAIATWNARLGRVVASSAHAFSRLEIDTAPALSKLPKRAQVVFVVDASISVGAETLAAQLAILRAYLTHVPDAEIEIVVYRRRASRVFGAFVHASQAGPRLETAIKAHAFALGNGSALDDGAKLASTALADRPGPRRVVLLTDELIRTSLTPAGALATLAKLSPETVVHVVVPATGDDRPSLERDDAHALAKLATRHHGILAHVVKGGADKQLPPIVLELVRPTRIEKLRVSGLVLDETVLHEGDGVRLFTRGKTAPARVTLTGELWSDPVRRDAVADEPFSRATAAFVFGADEHQELSPVEMMKVAMFGRAVSPVTSYVAFEPGTRPSTIGLDDLTGLGRSGFGSAGGGALGYADGVRRDLRSLIDPAACLAKHPQAGLERHARSRDHPARSRRRPRDHDRRARQLPGRDRVDACLAAGLQPGSRVSRHAAAVIAPRRDDPRRTPRAPLDPRPGEPDGGQRDRRCRAARRRRRRHDASGRAGPDQDAVADRLRDGEHLGGPGADRGDRCRTPARHRRDARTTRRARARVRECGRRRDPRRAHRRGADVHHPARRCAGARPGPRGDADADDRGGRPRHVVTIVRAAAATGA